VAVFPAIVLVAMITLALVPLPVWAVVPAETASLALLTWVLAFFRDPKRSVPTDRNLLLAPADGKITDIETVNENQFIGEPALRIGIFLSIFDVHINRAPCNVTVQSVKYKKGAYKNAMNPYSGRVNESNELELIRTDAPPKKLVVRQISGAIARRIVCSANAGQKLSGGERFGMIKFGSRTELYVPANKNCKCMVKVGDKVKAGLTALAKYETIDG